MRWKFFKNKLAFLFEFFITLAVETILQLHYNIFLMPDEFTINEKLGLMEIVSHGVVTAEDINSSIEKAKQVLSTKGINKLLVETTTQTKMPGTVSIFNIFSNFPREINLALIYKPDQLTAEDILFAENVAVNRGIRMKIFSNKKKAIAWLKEC